MITSAKIKVTIETEIKTRIEKFNKHKKQTPSKKTVSSDIFKYIHRESDTQKHRKVGPEHTLSK